MNTYAFIKLTLYSNRISIIRNNPANVAWAKAMFNKGLFREIELTNTIDENVGGVW